LTETFFFSSRSSKAAFAKAGGPVVIRASFEIPALRWENQPRRRPACVVVLIVICGDGIHARREIMEGERGFLARPHPRRSDGERRAREAALAVEQRERQGAIGVAGSVDGDGEICGRCGGQGRAVQRGAKKSSLVHRSPRGGWVKAQQGIDGSANAPVDFSRGGRLRYAQHEPQQQITDEQGEEFARHRRRIARAA